LGERSEQKAFPWEEMKVEKKGEKKSMVGPLEVRRDRKKEKMREEMLDHHQQVRQFQIEK
jgi:hypothetical protein